MNGNGEFERDGRHKCWSRISQSKRFRNRRSKRSECMSKPEQTMLLAS